MNFFIKKYQKSSLALISVALLSVSSLSQAEYEFQTSGINICKQGSYLDLFKESLTAYLGSEAEYEKYYQEKERGLRDNLRAQAFVSASTHLYRYNYQPRSLMSEATIYDYIAGGVSQYDVNVVEVEPDSFGDITRVTLRSFGRDELPLQLFIGRSTILGPGVHYQKRLESFIDSLAFPINGSRAECKTLNDTTW